MSYNPDMARPLARARQWVRSRADPVMVRLGYQRMSTVRQNPVDFRGLISDPLEALARTNGTWVLMNMPMHCLRGLKPIGFPCTLSSAHPFVLTAHQWLSGSIHSYADSPLRAYYDRVQPAHGAAILGVGARGASAALLTSEPIATDFPWRAAPSRAVKSERLQWLQEDARQHGWKLDNPNAWIITGPMLLNDGQFEFERICRVTQSIQQLGYDPSQANGSSITGTLLHEGNDCAVVVDVGQHRIAALAALGYREVSIVLRAQVVNPIWIDKWPGVREGAFTVDEAQAVFDRVLTGALPGAIAECWNVSASSH